MKLPNYIILDTECSGALKNNAHPFDPENKLLLVGIRNKDTTNILDIEYGGFPYNDNLRSIRECTRVHNFIVGFNIKFDLHWLQRYCGNLEGLKIWDCQLAEFILEQQKGSYPSLEDSCQKRLVSLKSNILSQYIESGLDVDQIPLMELQEYLSSDLVSTEELFLKQWDLIHSKGLWPLFNLQCQDLVVLQQMEFNGLKYDLEKSKSLAAVCQQEETEIEQTLNKLLVDVPFDFNWASGDHLSALLYGGTVEYEIKEQVGFYLTGKKAGLPRYRNHIHNFTFDRLVNPIEKSKLKKEGFWSVAEDVLKELNATGKAKEIIDGIARLTELQKIRGTYFEGIPKRFVEYGWEDGLVHGQLNQCVARTGRLASSKPNLQNNNDQAKECFISRYD